MLCDLTNNLDHWACTRCGRTVRPIHGRRPCDVRLRCGARPAKAVEPKPAADDEVPYWWPTDSEGAPIPQAELTADHLPCPHRGEPTGEGKCDVCGERGQPFQKYACAIKDECSLIPRRAGVPDCFKCEIRREACRPLVQLDAGAPVAAKIENRAVRVALLTPDLGAGGTERWIASLAKFLPRDRAELIAVGVVRDGQKWDAIAREITSTGTKVYGTRGVRWGIHPTEASTVTFIETDDEVCRRTMAGADVLISWGLPDPAALLAAGGWRGPHIVVSHGSSQWARDQLKTAVPTATHCVAVSSDAATAFPPGTSPDVIWNGSELERLAPTADRDTIRASWGCSADDLLVGFVGRLSPEKNPLAVALLAAALQKRIPSRRIRPVWIGTGLVQVVPGLQADAKAIAGDACVWVPPPAHIGDAWGALDLHVMASPEEGFSLVVTEALAVGVPTVATRVGIVSEILARFGQLVVPVAINPTGDQLADAATEALSDAHGRNVERAKRVTWAEFTAARMGRRWANYVRMAMGE